MLTEGLDLTPLDHEECFLGDGILFCGACLVFIHRNRAQCRNCSESQIYYLTPQCLTAQVKVYKPALLKYELHLIARDLHEGRINFDAFVDRSLEVRARLEAPSL